jgi:hypothetical protein
MKLTKTTHERTFIPWFYTCIQFSWPQAKIHACFIPCEFPLPRLLWLGNALLNFSLGSLYRCREQSLRNLW